ncbi:DegT/DnrJ/EryC1/StrS family aminotransferase [Paenibacillus ginsengarvi]|uniref:DegT/DnrJ/EryC1/StrS family aminotransferase n=1 Tax=Paenibacillus ginsengarvi TaxID=400777 RepID=A0A3B0CDK3_9BACL|nr:DegT/DnrJ/EryC1/StrS family aminotransferase [Paenibacillus ginsengarvi]RKN82109.1 DegT/DnrJ/EryC1/StrS family aminotransferase [Paenibacillus ginsengarvi]
MSKLALHGGTPVRSTPLPPNYPGAVVYGKEEAELASKVIYAQSPFRYYGPNMQGAVEALENAIVQDFDAKYALAVTSGTAALIVAMKALGIGYGDKVIVPANTFIATPGAVVCCNAVPVYCDVDDSLNLDPNDLERVYDEDVKAIIVVPILGNPVDMDPVMAFAKSKHIAVIEDMAQSCGVRYKGRYAGTIGDIGTFSFQMNKIVTSGEGGAVVTRDVSLLERAIRYHDQGVLRHRTRYGIDSPDELFAFSGQNYRMSELAGAVMLEQWKKLPTIVGSMKTHHDRIAAELEAEIPGIRYRACPDPDGSIGSNLGIVFPTAAGAASFNQALNAENVQSYVLYGGKPVYMNPSLFHMRSAEKNNFPYDYPFKQPVSISENMCPRAVDLIPRTVYIPMSPVLSDRDAADIVEAAVKVHRALQVFA